MSLDEPVQSIANEEYEKWSREGSTFDIEFREPNTDAYEQLLEMYEKIEPSKFKNQSIGRNIGLRLGRWSRVEAREYVDLTRRILAYTKSVQKYHNPEKWEETLKEMDKQRHQIHLAIKKIIRESLIDTLTKSKREKEISSLDEDKISFLVELILGNEIGNEHIWLTRLLPEEKVRIVDPEIAKEVTIREFEYISDWHDEGNPYKQVWIYFNPLKYRRDDIKIEIYREK